MTAIPLPRGWTKTAYGEKIDGFLLGKRYLLMDRDRKFSEAFRSILDLADVAPVKLPARSPNLNAHMERFMRSLKDECLNRVIFSKSVSPRHLKPRFLLGVGVRSSFLTTRGRLAPVVLRC